MSGPGTSRIVVDCECGYSFAVLRSSVWNQPSRVIRCKGMKGKQMEPCSLAVNVTDLINAMDRYEKVFYLKITNTTQMSLTEENAW